MVNCHYCGAPIDEATEVHVLVNDYPEKGCEKSRFCSRCVDVEADPAERGEQIKQLFIAKLSYTIAAQDAGPAAAVILPGHA